MRPIWDEADVCLVLAVGLLCLLDDAKNPLLPPIHIRNFISIDALNFVAPQRLILLNDSVKLDVVQIFLNDLSEAGSEVPEDSLDCMSCCLHVMCRLEAAQDVCG